jgi:Mrp family chromosome partitioning ATPase
MTALDRALIKAYRASGKAHASAYAEAIQAKSTGPLDFASHGAEAALAGPHWHRRAEDSQETGAAANAQTNVAGRTAAGNDSGLPLQFQLETNFRIDVGMAGVPSTPKGSPTPVAMPTVTPGATASAAPAPSPVAAMPSPVTHAPSRTMPLSAAAIMEHAPVVRTDEAKPQWVVDAFVWPEIAEELAYQSAASLDDWLMQLDSATGSSKTRMAAVIGTEPGVGTSTTLLAMALRAIAAGLRPALIDANAANPQLAGHLSVLAQSGWESVISGQTSLGSALIESLTDQAVLLPMVAPVTWSAMNRANLRHTLPWRILATEYDILLFDAGNAEHEADAANLRALCQIANLTGVFAVCDARCTTPDELIIFSRRLKSAGVNVLGTIENFVGTANLGHGVA